ncbi:MAG: hypothetical protein AAF961_07295 [Planctomycetota bacterium]
MTLPTDSQSTFGSFTPVVVTALPTSRVMHVPGATLLLVESALPEPATSALKSLRGFRAAGRRVLWCDTTDLAESPHAAMERWGTKFVELGGADLAVLVGNGAREAAIGARDAGLSLNRVVVCPSDATARNVLCDVALPGDTFLLLGLREEMAERLLERLETKFQYVQEAVAALV